MCMLAEHWLSVRQHSSNTWPLHVFCIWRQSTDTLETDTQTTFCYYIGCVLAECWLILSWCILYWQGVYQYTGCVILLANTAYSKFDLYVIYMYVHVCDMPMDLFYLEGHDEVNITVEIKPDNTPEVAEVFTVNLVNVSNLDRLQIGAVSIYTWILVFTIIIILFAYKLISALSKVPKLKLKIFSKTFEILASWLHVLSSMCDK